MIPRSMSMAVLVAALAFGSLAFADTAETVAAQRQAHFKQLGGLFKAINDELRKAQPDRSIVEADAARLKDLAAQLPSWFPRGSGPGDGMKTDAKRSIWADPAGFAAATTRLKAETTKLDMLSTTGDLPQIGAQVRAVGSACKNCHEQYRRMSLPMF